MKLDELLKPVAPDAPCGPDLHDTMDAGFDDYYFGALGRLPSYYFRPGVERPDGTLSQDMIFDSGSVDIAAERREIETLLERSRDIRLLVLLAQWEVLAGRLDPMADAVEAIAAMIETFGDEVHPSLAQGPSDRREALGDLNAQVTVVQPLQFLGLTGTDEVSLRKIKVAAGGIAALQSEQDITPGMMSDALADPGNKKRLEVNHAALVRLAEALGRIARACQGHDTKPFSLTIDLVATTVQEMLGAISAVRPELKVVEVEAPPKPEPVAEAQTGSAPAPDMPAGPEITGHGHARLTLEACEHYYRRSEPSSAALLLVTQARLLIGRPLIEALETLLPDKAGQTVVDFGPQTGFVLNIDRLRQLTDSAPQSPLPKDEKPEKEGAPPVISSSAQAAAAMRAVELYFARAERSSPVPILLQRARSYLDRDFQSLVDELVPVVETNQ